MRTIHLANEKKRDAEVGFEPVGKKRAGRKAAPGGAPYETFQVLDETLATAVETLRRETPDAVALGRALVAGDPEVDTELFGRRADGMHKVWITAAGEIAYDVAFKRRVLAPDGTVKEMGDLVETPANVALEDRPVRWTGKLFPKKDIVRTFFFERSVALRHVNGLTYDFLHEMAKKLADAKAMMAVAAPTEKGKIVLTRNGTPYYGFLEGRVDGEKYLLVLHLTKLKLAELPGKEAAPRKEEKTNG